MVIIHRAGRGDHKVTASFASPMRPRCKAAHTRSHGQPWGREGGGAVHPMYSRRITEPPGLLKAVLSQRLQKFQNELDPFFLVSPLRCYPLSSRFRGISLRSCVLCTSTSSASKRESSSESSNSDGHRSESISTIQQN